MRKTCFEKRRRVPDGRRAHREIGSDGRSRHAQAPGALAGADTNPAGNPEHHLEAADFRRGLQFVGALRRGFSCRRRRHLTLHIREGSRAKRTRRLRILHDQRIQIGRTAAARGSHRRDGQRHIRPVLSGRLGDLGAAHQFERGLAVLRAGVEPGIVERRPARVAHAVGHPQRRSGRRGGGKIDPDLELARRLGRAIRLEPGDLAVDVPLLAFRLADRGVRAGYFLRDRGKGGAPLVDRTRFALLAQPRGRALRKALGELAARVGRVDRAFEIAALVLQRLDALVEFRQIDRRRGTRRPGVDGADGELRSCLALDPKRGWIERQREIVGHQRSVAGSKIGRQDARNAGAIGVNGNSIDRGRGVDIGRLRRHGGKGSNNNQTGRYKTVRNPSHEFPPENLCAACRPWLAWWSGRTKNRLTIVMRRCDQGTGSIEVTVRRRRGGAGAAGRRKMFVAWRSRRQRGNFSPSPLKGKVKPKSSRNQSTSAFRIPRPWPASPAAAPAPWRSRPPAPRRRPRPARWRRRPAWCGRDGRSRC